MKQSRSRHRGHMISRSISGWVGSGLMGSNLLLICPAASAATLSAWQFDPATQQFTVTLPGDVTPRFLVAAEPARIILEIPRMQLGRVDAERLYDGSVRSIRLVQADANVLQVVLELAPDVVLDPNHAQLTSMQAGDQTRWILTPLIAEAGTIASYPAAVPIQSNTGELPHLPGVSSEDDAVLPADLAADSPAARSASGPSSPLVPSSTDLPSVSSQDSETISPTTTSSATPSHRNDMVVELPVIPAAESEFAFPAAGEGRLSTTAANLMLPSDVDSLDNLPETLPIDPFSIGLAGNDQVTVPGLDQLDAEVGPVATLSQEIVQEPEGLAATASQPDVIASFDEDAAATEEGLPIVVAPPVVQAEPGQRPNEAIVPVPALPDETEPSVITSEPASVPDTVETSEAPAVAPGLDLVDDVASTPSGSTVASDESIAAEPDTDAVEIAVVPADPEPEPAIAADTDLQLAEDSGHGNTTDASESDSAPEIVAEPISEAPPVAETEIADANPSTEPLPLPQAESVAIPVENSSTEIVVEPAPEQDVLVVPELPDTDSTDSVTPPNTAATSELIVAVAEPIWFGQPLPGMDVEVPNSSPDRDRVAPDGQQVPPDILIAAGTVLQLRYPGNEPLTLESGRELNEVLLLETEIRDPITQGVLAPRGSQLIGQFEPSGTNQHWVSEMIIVPAGQRVPLSSTSEYLVGSPQVDGGRLAAGTGIGALAFTLLTGFTGIGLLGGAVIGATTMVGTSPQQVVIEPNQIIAVQVTENVPRAMPIAAGPDLSRDWGTE